MGNFQYVLLRNIHKLCPLPRLGKKVIMEMSTLCRFPPILKYGFCNKSFRKGETLTS